MSAMRALEPAVVALANEVLTTVAWGAFIVLASFGAAALALWLIDRDRDEE